ncbi:protein BCCIP homolog isoform X2 [Tripterygium wilfordii]|uniref:protein BCCIP homolog isoform X2 n=1 Tax=Tripterygium wilfordii TaxID=458696 RepID=UPI0018F81AB6|nr:protein BCCIP homolog isoform X2 [Tripterygium wilfordii]
MPDLGLRKVVWQLYQMRESKLSSPDPEGIRFSGNDSKEKNEVSEELDSEGVVQADFAFFDPKPDDFHGVKILLQTYLDDKQWDLSGFVDLILEQTTVGTVVKIEDDEDDGLFSIITALNLGRYKGHKSIKELKEFLLKACKQKDVMKSLRSLLEEQAQSVGLLVSQRVVNLPPQLLPPLYDALFDEISWAIEDEPTKELRNSFCFKNYLIATKIYRHNNADQKKWQNSHSDEAIIYIKPEDEIFHQLCLWSFMFPLRTQQVAAQELRNYQSMGLVMAVEAEKIPTFQKQLHSFIHEL